MSWAKMESMRRASIQIHLEDNCIVQGSVWSDVLTGYSIEHYMYDYWLEETWIDGRKIVDIEVTSVALNSQISKKLIRLNSTFGKDKKEFGESYVPFVRYKIIQPK
jgi:hypothetical protein